MSTKTLQYSADITPWPPVYIANYLGLSEIQRNTDIFSILIQNFPKKTKTKQKNGFSNSYDDSTIFHPIREKSTFTAN